MRWLPGEVSTTPSEILAAARGGDIDKTGALAEAKAFLMDLLANGPVLNKEVRRQATSAGLAWSTVRRAKRVLGILSRKQSLSGPWEWVISPKGPKSSKMLKPQT